MSITSKYSRGITIVILAFRMVCSNAAPVKQDLSSMHSGCGSREPLLLKKDSQDGFVGHWHVALSSGEQCRSWKCCEVWETPRGDRQFVSQQLHPRKLLHATFFYMPEIPGELILPRIHAKSFNLHPKYFFNFNL